MHIRVAANISLAQVVLRLLLGSDVNLTTKACA
jgi:hypothetical protein